jgi:hypothetical protein
MAYTAYLISEPSRALILQRFAPKFGDVICHHVTVRFGVPKDEKPPPPARLCIVGYVCDASLEALVVSVDGATTRPDGMTYHITLSLDRTQGRKPADSNALIAKAGWSAVEPLAIAGSPSLC